MGNNITVPYTGYITGGLHDGLDVVIAGRPTYDFRRFSFNLCSGPNYDSGDVALHFNPRFDDGKVVRNHKQAGSWGVEETEGGMPFRRGHLFEVHIAVDHHGYKIKVNNSHFCTFHHRLSKAMVQYLYIEGDVTITYIQFREQHGHHGHHHHGHHHVPPPSFPVPSYPSGCPGPIYNPPVPFTTPIQGGMHVGKMICINGVPYPNPSRFTINLQCGAYDSADIALHFDVRFNYGGTYNTVVRTHRDGGGYGTEDKHQNYFPFTPGVGFEVMILAEHNMFKIAVNNQHFTEFHYRIHPLQRIECLNVVGDVQLTQVRFQ